MMNVEDVRGKCPACHNETLFLGSGGYVTCGWTDCPAPDAASQLLYMDMSTKIELKAWMDEDNHLRIRDQYDREFNAVPAHSHSYGKEVEEISVELEAPYYPDISPVVTASFRMPVKVRTAKQKSMIDRLFGRVV